MKIFRLNEVDLVTLGLLPFIGWREVDLIIIRSTSA